ncbi:DedA family protein [Rhodospirillaceae bacterium SYSU D60014]|uniref:DedA family protein n=1 Tax=Virgifigura deserti TaxID=2268457 RepID=UPI000E675DF8
MADWIKGVMDSLGYPGIALLMFLENIFPPIPSEVIMPMAGFTASSGELTLIGVVVAGVAGSLIGALPWYFAGRLYGGDRLKRFADRHGRWLGVSRDDIERVTAWFGHHGRTAVLIGRLVPGVRTLISAPAGVCGMPLLSFLIYSGIGTLGWTAVLAYAGVLLQSNWSVVGDYVGPIGSIVVGLIVAWFVVRLIRNRCGG